MSRIDIGQNIMKPTTVPATAEGFWKAVDDKQTAAVCAELADLLEQKRRGELRDEEYHELKGKEKRRCRFYTPHAHFKKGYKSSKGEPVDSGKAVIDLDGCEHFAELYEQHLKGREKELGVNMVNRSVSGTGGHVLFDIPEGMTRQEAQAWMAHELGDADYDKAVHERERAVYIPCRDYILYLDEERMFSDELNAITGVKGVKGVKEVKEVKGVKGVKEVKGEKGVKGVKEEKGEKGVERSSNSLTPPNYPQDYHGIPFADIIKKYWEVNNRGFEPTQGDRDTLTYQLACDLRHICGRSFEWLDQVIPCYDGFPVEEKRAKIRSALQSEFNGFPTRLRNVLTSLTPNPSPKGEGSEYTGSDSDDEQSSIVNCKLSIKKMPMGVRDSVEAVGETLAMPMVTAICPCIGALATGVRLDVHGQKRGLNLIAYIAGDFASGKGGIDPVVEAWMSEVAAMDKMYLQQEDEWRQRKRAAKNKKEQPEEPKLPVRFLTLNNTVANLAERLKNTEGRHAFSFTPEADTVAQKWRSAMSDFSVMLRQSYDGTKYEREARSADAVSVHIDHLLWNVTMCGTPDALYRVVSNYTDGFQSRIALSRTPDNTFQPLDTKPYVLTEAQQERIRMVAHLLPLMQGEVVLAKLEKQGREWLERIRIETMKNDDKVRARQRFRVCVTAQRMTCCVMLCKVCEGLIQRHGLTAAETLLKQQPDRWKTLLAKAQTPQMLEVFDVIADALLENALYFFRERIENAFNSREYAGGASSERQRRGRNDTIFSRLEQQFTFEQAMQQTIAIKGASVSQNAVQQMLKNWRKQGLVVMEAGGRFRKIKG